MRLPVAVVASICLVGHLHAAEAAWIADLEAGLVYEDNVNLAEKARDTLSDTALGTSVSAGAVANVVNGSVVSLTGDVAGVGYTRFTGLTNLYLGATAPFRHKFGLGAAAPWVRVSGSGARLEYREDVRDGWRYRLATGSGKRLGERWEVRVEYAYDRRTAEHEVAITPRPPGDVFGRSSHTISSTTPRNAETFAASTAVTLDPAFGPDAFAYEIGATTHLVTVGLSFALGPQSSLNLGYERQIGL